VTADERGDRILCPRARTATTAGLARLRHGSLAVLVLPVLEHAIGMYVNLYVTVPGDHDGSLGSAISSGQRR
jgi:hypothetical protein